MRLLLIIFIIPFFSHSQLEDYQFHVYNRYSVGKIDTAIYANISIAGEYRVHKYIGLNYSLEKIFRNDNITQLHTTMGVLAGPILFVAMVGTGTINTGSKLGLILLAFAIPEGLSIHIPYRYKYDFSPYFNLLGFDYIKNKNTHVNNFRFASSLGFKTTYCFNNNLTLTAFTELRNVSNMGLGFGGGFGIGYAFTPPEKED